MSDTTLRVVLVAVGGALGSLGRYFLSGYIGRVSMQWFHIAPYPWGTTSVNLLGSLLFGIFWSTLGRDASGPWKLFLLGGILGAFTTFSTFMFESVQLLQKGRPLAALSNLALQNIVGLICIFVGFSLGGLLMRLWGRGV